MFKALVLFIGLLFLSNSVTAQAWKYTRQEVQLGIGASSFFGELGGSKGEAKHDFRDLRLSATRPAFTLSYKYILIPAVSVRGVFSAAYVSGDDASTKNLVRMNRNLSFRSGIWGLDAMIDIYPFSENVTRRYRIRGVSGKSSLTLSPYVSLGFGAVFFQPKALLDGTWHKLQPLGTEGQGLAGRPDKYKRYTFTLPLAVGIKYMVDERLSIGFELSVKYTGSDYIDDVSTSYYLPEKIAAANGEVAAQLADRGLDPSLGMTGVLRYNNGSNNYLQRGDPAYNDAYSIAIFTVQYRLRKGTKFIPKF